MSLSGYAVHPDRLRQERGWDPCVPTPKTDGSKRPEPLEVNLGPTVIANE